MSPKRSSTFSKYASRLSKGLSKSGAYLSKFARQLPKFSWVTGLLVLIVIVLVGLPMVRAALSGLNPFSALMDIFSGGKITIITSDAIIDKIEQVSELTTTKYTIQVVTSVKKSAAGWDFLGVLTKSSMLMIAKGRVEVGLDLAQLDKSDISVSKDGKTVVVNLPPVKIFNHGYILSDDPNDTYVYDSSEQPLGSLGGLESKARTQAAQVILESACKDGIMQQATNDAQVVVERFLSAFVENVTVNSGPVPSVEECKTAPASE